MCIGSPDKYFLYAFHPIGIFSIFACLSHVLSYAGSTSMTDFSLFLVTSMCAENQMSAEGPFRFATLDHAAMTPCFVPILTSYKTRVIVAWKAHLKTGK